jgi:hypothetical protein
VALAITINGTDRISLLRWGSLTIERTAGDRPGRADFTLTNLPTGIGMGQTVVIADGATTYFTGDIRAYTRTEWVVGSTFTSVSALDDGAAPAAANAPFSLADRGPATVYQDLLNGLVPLSWWRLGESTGTTAVDEMLNRDGTYVGSPTLSVAGPMTTDPDTAITLNGSSQWVDVGAYQLAGQTSFTIAGWGKTSYSGASQVIYAERTAAGTGAWVLFYLDTNGRPTLQYRDNAGTSDTIVPPSGNWADGTWHHFAVTKFGTDVYIFVDGASVRHTTLTANDTLSGTLLALIGKDAHDGHYWTGSLDEVMIYDVDLSAQEVKRFYNVRTIQRYRTLVTGSTWDGTGSAVYNATVTTDIAGLAAGQTLAITSANHNNMVVMEYSIQELRMTWENASSILWTATCGSAPLHLAAAFP